MAACTGSIAASNEMGLFCVRDPRVAVTETINVQQVHPHMKWGCLAEGPVLCDWLRQMQHLEVLT